MDKQKHIKQASSLGKAIVVIALLAYISFTVGASINRNYQTNQIINGLKDDIATLKLRIANEQDLLVYYNTDSFKEVETRRRLGAIAPGETLVILPKHKRNAIEGPGMVIDENQNVTDRPVSTQLKSSNLKLWWQFIFNQQS